jgi:hypothetical protein
VKAPLSDPGDGGEEEAERPSLTEEIFQRLLEAEDGSFTLADFANYDISIPAQRDELIQKLDDLDRRSLATSPTAPSTMHSISRSSADIDGMTALDLKALGAACP